MMLSFANRIAVEERDPCRTLGEEYLAPEANHSLWRYLWAGADVENYLLVAKQSHNLSIAHGEG